MKTLTTINDLHLGARRTGGTTIASSDKLRWYLLDQYKTLLGCIKTDLLINGDWLDTFSIDLRDLLQVYDITCEWLIANPTLKFYPAAGNHDRSKDSTKTSSFDFLSGLLSRRFPSQVFPINEPMALPDHNAYVIPHVINQETFDAAIAAVPPVDTLYVHANYDNDFAVHADHSLNLALWQARALQVKTIVFGHEHQAKTAMNGKVLVVGNQFPSSIADCLGNSEKSYLVGTERVECWSAPGSFEEQDWQNLSNGPQFVRVVGKARSDQAGDVVAAIARFRATSDAFVITNAVEIAGLDDNESISSNLEQINNFSVLGALLEILSEEEGAVVKQLLEKQNA